MLILIVAPSRGALRHARARCEDLVTKAGRRLVIGLPVEAPEGPGPLAWVGVDEPGWRARAEAMVRVNVARDALNLAGCGIILGLLDVDYPRFGALAPDLWSVRTAVFRHDQADPLPAMPRVAKGAGAPPTDAPVPPELESLARTLPLRALRVREGEGDGRTLSLDSLYVPLDAIAERSLTDQPQKPGNVKTLLETQRLAVLEAPAGAGKSTALRRAARDWARAGESVLWAPARRLPSRIWGDELLDDLTVLQSVCPWPVAQDRRPTLVLDGLDELGDAEARAALALAVADLVLFGLVERAALSARPGALAGGGPRHLAEPLPPRAVDALTRFRLLPLSAEQMRAYVTLWAEATESKQSQRAELRGRLVTALGLGTQAHRAVRERALCERPLFLAVFCALYGSEDAQVERESELLDALVTASIRPRPSSGLRSGDRRWLAGKVAWEMHTSNRTTLPAFSLLEGDAPLLLPEELEALRLQTGLLIEAGEEVSFAHLALQELLAAERAWDCVEWWDDEILTRFLRLHWYVWNVSTLPNLGGVTWLFLESAAERTPARLERFLRKLGLPGVSLALLLTTAWPIRPPLALRGLWKDAAESLFREHQAQPPGEVMGRFMRIIIAKSLASLGDERIGRLEWRDIGDGWQVARWPVTRGQYQTFMMEGGYIDGTLWSEAGLRWRAKPAKNRAKDRPAGWSGADRDLSSVAVSGLSRHEADAFVRWCQRVDPRVCLPTPAVWRRAARGAPHFGSNPNSVYLKMFVSPDGISVGTVPELASAAGVEDLGVLVRERIANDRDARAVDCWAGRAFSDPYVPLKDSIGLTAHPSGRDDHLFGLRLARRPPNR
ncbi:formylglycine-generating enzyme family protein [Myxococcota bacterium]|nr:formylglycine-generating enzyme family protein [Myxococcota bacterium]